MQLVKDVWLKPDVSEVVVCHYTTGSGCSGTFPQKVIELKCGRQQKRPTIAKLYFSFETSSYADFKNY